MMIQDTTLKTRSEANPADRPPHRENKQKKGFFVDACAGEAFGPGLKTLLCVFWSNLSPVASLRSLCVFSSDVKV